jgi:hypothetical protein
MSGVEQAEIIQNEQLSVGSLGAEIKSFPE